MPDARSTAPRRHKCPLCRKPSTLAHSPFCSQGCRDRDLLNWLGDGYRVPGPPVGEGEAGNGSRGLDSEG